MERLYRINLTEMERKILIRVLAEKHNQMLDDGEYPDMIDDMILKIGKTPAKLRFFTNN